MAAPEGGFEQSYATGLWNGNRMWPLPMRSRAPMSDIPSGLGPAGKVKLDLTPRGAADGRHRADHAGGRFRAALGPGSSSLSDRTAGAAPPFCGWFPVEVPVSVRRDVGTAGPAPASRITDRILVGRGADGCPEARIRFGTGALAGAEIRLSCVPGQRAIEAQLLTSVIGSRQTLSVAMDEIRLRLRGKGIVLSSGRPAGPADREREGADRRGRKGPDR